MNRFIVSYTFTFSNGVIGNGSTYHSDKKSMLNLKSLQYIKDEVSEKINTESGLHVKAISVDSVSPLGFMTDKEWNE